MSWFNLMLGYNSSSFISCLLTSPASTCFSWEFLTFNAFEACAAIKIVRYTLQLWQSYRLSLKRHSSASLSLHPTPPTPPISSPLCEPQAKTKPQGDGATSLWTNLVCRRLSNVPMMSPHFGKQSKSNVCSADNVSNQNGLPAWQLYEKMRER